MCNLCISQKLSVFEDNILDSSRNLQLYRYIGTSIENYKYKNSSIKEYKYKNKV